MTILELNSYQDMSTLDADLLGKLADKEREWWGYQGFGEYAICSHPSCRAVLSIDEVYAVSQGEDYQPLTALERDGPRLPGCPECGGSTELLLPRALFIEYLRYYFSHGVYGTLLLDDERRIRGATVALRTSRRTALERIINYRNSYRVDSCLAAISRTLGDTHESDGSEPVVCWSRVALGRDLRGRSHLHRIVSDLLALQPNNADLPLLGDTRFDTRLHPILKAIGFRDVATDAHGCVMITLKRQRTLTEAFALTPEEFKAQFDAEVTRCRDEQMTYLASHRPFASRKRFIGAPLLREVFGSPDFVPARRTNESTIENLTSAELTPKTIGQIGDLFRYLFCNGFGQYLFYPSVGAPISAAEAHGVPHGTYVPLAALDAFAPATFPRNPTTGERAVFWHHPDVVPKKLVEKLAKDANIGLLWDDNHARLLGFIFGHHCTLAEAFLTEEWHNPHYYSGLTDGPHLRDLSVFCDALNAGLAKAHGALGVPIQTLAPETELYVWNCFGTVPEARRGAVFDLARSFFRHVKPRENELVIGEAKYGSTAHTMFRRAGAIDVPGFYATADHVIESGDGILMLG
ncbi:MAG: hypothetical protein HQL39_06175, partial [Alphaproteobacteria bacterium]|nr:hypothetical protein [Alphaproteobacteria bacterium]